MKAYLFPAAIAAIAFATTSMSVAQTMPDWQIGPIIRGKNYSVGMPLRPNPTRQGWYFDFPRSTRADGHVHYITHSPGSLADKSRIVVRYRVTAKPGTKFVPQEDMHLPGVVSVYLQRRGDNWSAKGRYAFYRWYAPDHTVQNIAPGVHEMIVNLDDPQWHPVVGGLRSGMNSQAFDAALADTHQLGLVFGSTRARGHGVFATAQARFELISFKVE